MATCIRVHRDPGAAHRSVKTSQRRTTSIPTTTDLIPCQRFARNCATRRLAMPHVPALGGASQLRDCEGTWCAAWRCEPPAHRWHARGQGFKSPQLHHRSGAFSAVDRRLLTHAQIPSDIDAALLPVTARFAAEEQQRQGKVLDGPDVVTQIRNRLVHPRGAQERVYRLDGLVAEVWRLTRHYLVLLILHSLGYQGSYRDLRKTGGWAGDVGDVPWSRTGAG
jgi:hypothetical protein